MDRTEAGLVAALFAASGVASLVGSRGRHLSWVLFFTIAALIWLGHRP
jgi:hypothetical protein